MMTTMIHNRDNEAACKLVHAQKQLRFWLAENTAVFP